MEMFEKSFNNSSEKREAGSLVNGFRRVAGGLDQMHQQRQAFGQSESALDANGGTMTDSLSIGNISEGVASKIAPNATNADIRRGWDNFESKIGELKDSGRYDAANRHPKAINSIESKVGIRFESLDQAQAAVQIQRQLADQYFDGDARKAMDHIVEMGKDPEFANLPFTLENLSKGLERRPQPSVNSSPEAPENVEPSPTEQAQSASPEMPSIQNEASFEDQITEILSRRDAQGHWDPNGDGVGGIQGLMKSIMEHFQEGAFSSGNSSIFSEVLNSGGAMPGQPQWQPDISGKPMVGVPYDPFGNSLAEAPTAMSDQVTSPTLGMPKL